MMDTITLIILSIMMINGTVNCSPLQGQPVSAPNRNPSVILERQINPNSRNSNLEKERYSMAEVQGAIKYVSGLSDSNLWKFLTDGVSAFTSCFAEDEHIDPILGPLRLDADIYCNGTGRNIRRITCCTPQTTEEIEMKFLYFNPKHRQKMVQIDFHDKKLRKKFEKSDKKIVIVAHGFHESIRVSPWLNGTRDGWLDRGHEVIVIEWSHGNQVSYWQAAANVRTVGLALGYAIYHWKIWDKVLIVGFSMGGQIAGEAGKFIKSHGKLIQECHALDPAGPYFDGGSNEVNLDKSDCGVVQVIHTSASQSPETSIAELSTLRIGTSKKVGHCDYWINCGHYQMGKCPSPNYVQMFEAFANSTITGDDGPLFTNLQEQIACSHNRGGIIYVSALKRKCNFVSYVCINCGQLQQDDICKSDQSKGPSTLPPDSRCTSDMDIDYLLHTQKDGHFCNSGEIS